MAAGRAAGRRQRRRARGLRQDAGGADEEALSILFDQGLGKRVEIGEGLGPDDAARAAHRGLGTIDALLELGIVAEHRLERVEIGGGAQQ